MSFDVLDICIAYFEYVIRQQASIWIAYYLMCIGLNRGESDKEFILYIVCDL
jgi:hypothetical protein